VLQVGEEPPPMEPLLPTGAGGSRSAFRGTKGSADHSRSVQGRFRVLNEFVDTAMSRLSRADLAVWLVLYRDSRDGTAQASQADIARRARLNVRNVRRALDRLQALGLVEVVSRGALHGPASRYRVLGTLRAELAGP
jgi:hypothetical protein